MHDSLLVEEGKMVKFSLVPFGTFLHSLQLLLQGYFHQEGVKQSHCRDTQRLNIRNCLVPTEANCHPVLFSKTVQLLLQELLKKVQPVQAHIGGPCEASSPSEILQDRYLACRRISFGICYITLKTSIRFKEHMKRGAHLLAPGPAGVEDRFVRELMLLLEGISVGGQSTREREGSPM